MSDTAKELERLRAEYERLRVAGERVLNVCALRAYRGSGCPFCSSRLVVGGCDDDCPRMVFVDAKRRALEGGR